MLRWTEGSLGRVVGEWRHKMVQAYEQGKEADREADREASMQQALQQALQHAPIQV